MNKEKFFIWEGVYHDFPESINEKAWNSERWLNSLDKDDILLRKNI